MKTQGSTSLVTRFFPVFSRWLGWGTLRAFCLVVALLATAVVLYYQVENWRGLRAWKQAARAIEAKGERLDFAAFLPPPAAEEANFAQTPLLKPLMEYHRGPDGKPVWQDPAGSQRVQQLAPWAFAGSLVAKAPSLVLCARGQRVDLAAWQAYFRGSNHVITAAEEAQLTEVQARLRQRSLKLDPRPEVPISPAPQAPAADVLLALSPLEAPFAELRAASERPRAQFPMHYQDSPFLLYPHLTALMSLGRALALQATAEATLGKTEAAQADIVLGFRLANLLRAEPLYLSHSMRGQFLGMALQPLWEGLSDRRWSEAQLAGFQALIQPIDLLSDFYTVSAGERALANQAIDLAIGGRLSLQGLGKSVRYSEPDEQAERLETLLQFGPRGWLYQNKVAYNRRVESRLGLARELAKSSVCPPGLVEAFHAEHRPAPQLSNYVAGLMMDYSHGRGAAKETLRVQTYLRLAQAACALERHRRAQGEYPEQLAALVPAYLKAVPIDIMNGAPLTYRRSPDNAYLLYSVGLNGVDEDGENARVGGGPDVWGSDNGPDDWVWVTKPNAR